MYLSRLFDPGGVGGVLGSIRGLFLKIILSPVKAIRLAEYLRNLLLEIPFLFLISKSIPPYL